MKIIFMGTPEFAVPSLQLLHESGCDIVGVVTAPDKPKGRGRKMLGTPVKAYAEQVALNILQPTNLKNQAFIKELANLKADVQVVVAFRMLPKVVWEMPPKGTFNLHGSLLPQYRGAAPINWAIINGEQQTGVTTFFLKHKIDTGNIIMQATEPIGFEDTVGELYERLMHQGAKLVLQTVRMIEKGTPIDIQPQDESGELKSAPKLHKDTCEINWNQSSEEIRNFVRGLSPYPAAWTVLEGKKFKIYQVANALQMMEGDFQPSYLATDNKTFLAVKTHNGWLDLTSIQMEGKRKMLVEDLLRGYKFDSK